MEGNQSEVARTIAEIDAWVLSTRRALTGFSAVARHELVRRRYDALGKHIDTLAGVVGRENALSYAVEATNKLLEDEMAPGSKKPKEEETLILLTRTQIVILNQLLLEKTRSLALTAGSQETTAAFDVQFRHNTLMDVMGKFTDAIARREGNHGG